MHTHQNGIRFMQASQIAHLSSTQIDILLFSFKICTHMQCDKCFIILNKLANNRQSICNLDQ